MAPKAVLRQWQLELREKFNLNFPIYDGDKLHWPHSPALQGKNVVDAPDDQWFQQPFLLVSSHLARRRERAAQLLEQAEEWDLVILDEAHHARRRGSGDPPKDVPNLLLRLMRQLAKRAKGLILLTATPMQIHPVEVWDLLNLLGLPKSWTSGRFLEFFRQTAHLSPDNALLEATSALFRDVEEHFAPMAIEKANALAGDPHNFVAKKVLAALREKASTPRSLLSAQERRVALKLMRQHNPIKMLVSRHTRELLRAYRKAGKLASNIAARQVQDIMVELSPAERAVYENMEDYISRVYNKSSPKNRSAAGFVMTIYRRRLSSSFYALKQTLRSRLAALEDARAQLQFNEEDMPEDDWSGDAMEETEAEKRGRQALMEEEKEEIASLLAQVKQLPTDSKAKSLFAKIEELAGQGYKQVIVFTQYTDTLDFLRAKLLQQKPDAQALCFSGRDGERWRGGEWEKISRDKTREIFRKGEAEIMFCTDAAAEGLNFQFCGALINYDMPWNPMKVEQRIGRIDRLGQKYNEIKIVNFMYANTVEADIYHALRQRISLFGAFVGKLQPILARLPKTFEEIALAGGDRSAQLNCALQAMSKEIANNEESDFDLDEMSDAGLAEAKEHEPAYDLAWLEHVLEDAALLPPGYEAVPLTRHQDYKYYVPGLDRAIRVTCDKEFYAEHAESVELWSPGSPAFPGPME